MNIEKSAPHSKFVAPLRAPKEWQECAPQFVIDCFDNEQASGERFKVYLGGTIHEPSLGRGAWYLGLSETPDSVDGTSIWDDCDATIRPVHQRVRWLDLPEAVRHHVIARVHVSI